MTKKKYYVVWVGRQTGIFDTWKECNEQISGFPKPFYKSFSRNAIVWTRDKQTRTNHNKSDKNKKLFELIDRAIKWLNENTYGNEILKWETKAWEENLADFGRK